MQTPVPEMVAVTKVVDVDSREEIRAGVYAALDLLGARIAMPAGARVVVKTNLCLIKGSETGATVDPFVARCLVDWLCDRHDPAEIVIAEADATHLSASLAFQVLGWVAMFSSLPRVRLLNLSADERTDVRLDGLYFKCLEMSRTYMEADYLISLAKLKTHTLQRISCAMKNLWGAWPERVKITYHPYLDRVICDLVRARVPDLSLVDGIIAHEGAGPVDGAPLPAGLLVAGTHPVATDHACARLMGVRPAQVPHLRLALRTGLGHAGYRVVGVPIESARLRFEFIPAWVRAWYAVKRRLVASAA